MNFYTPLIGNPAVVKVFPDLAAAENQNRNIEFRLSNYTTDAHQIVSTLARLARHYGTQPEVRNFVNGILPADTPDNDAPALLSSVVAFMESRITYVPDPQGIEYVTSPMRLIRDLCQTGKATGDCDDQALLLNSFLNSVGFTTYMTGVKVNGADYFNHVISTIRVAGNLIDVDLCRSGTPFFQYGPRRIQYNSTP